ncbi:7-carboxy-7-deazaguanine synthase QueE [Lactococcus petauri]
MNLNFTDEYVFYTVQGEGQLAGFPSVFVRLSGCNLRCSWRNTDGTLTKCDTPHSSFYPEKNIQDIGETIDKILAFGCDHVVVTGGEPFLQGHVAFLIDQLVLKGCHVTVETNGTKYLPTKASLLSISPKLSTSSCDPESGIMHNLKRINLSALFDMMKNNPYQLKFVINTDAELQEVIELVKDLTDLGVKDVYKNVWLMPQGITTEQFNERAEMLFEACKKYGFKYSDRLHVRIFGNKKGV